MDKLERKEMGLYNKFKVERVDGKSAKGKKHDGCEYFVLDLTHDPHAIPALEAYKESCFDDGYVALAEDLEDTITRAEWVQKQALNLKEIRERHVKSEAEAVLDANDAWQQHKDRDELLKMVDDFNDYNLRLIGQCAEKDNRIAELEAEKKSIIMNLSSSSRRGLHFRIAELKEANLKKAYVESTLVQFQQLYLKYKLKYVKSEAKLDAFQWQPIETAPKGGGAESTSDPNYVQPPRILLYFPTEGIIEAGRWDCYYAEGGNGYEGCSAWCCAEYEPAALAYDEPTHWMPLPEPPQALNGEGK